MHQDLPLLVVEALVETDAQEGTARQHKEWLSLPYENMSSSAPQDVSEKLSEGDRRGMHAAPPSPTSSSSEATPKPQHDSTPQLVI